MTSNFQKSNNLDDLMKSTRKQLSENDI